MNSFDTIIIGGGAAGVFAAIQLAERKPNARILIIEKAANPLQKVKVSGGGRCNVTHECFEPPAMAQNYPRGAKWIKPLLFEFGPLQTIAWFRKKGIELHAEADGRMFPTTNQSQTIIDCFLNCLQEFEIKLNTSEAITQLELDTQTSFWKITTTKNVLQTKTVLMASGGNPKLEGYQKLSNLGISIVQPVPSLFTFNEPKNTLSDLMGLSVKNGKVKIAGTKIQAEGPILITHWGISGPAVLKCSAIGAALLAEKKYQFIAIVNWVVDFDESQLKNEILLAQNLTPKTRVRNKALFHLPTRLWEKLLDLAQIPIDFTWQQMNEKSVSKLINKLTAFELAISGKTTYKEEFVTAGGVDLAEINSKTMESTKHANLFFAGEILNVDGITGGFNFQNAWTSAYFAAKGIAEKI